MGLRVNKKTFSRSHGLRESIYCRIERLLYKKVNGTLSYTLQFFTSKEEMDEMYTEYVEDSLGVNSVVIPYTSYLIVESGSVSGSQILDIDESGSEIYGAEIQLPLYNTHILSSSYETTEDIYETIPVYNTITYTDYDEEGNLVEKERQEYSGSVTEKVGEEAVIKTKYDHHIILSSSIYDVGYEYVKKDLENFFGSGSIEDVI